MDRRLVKFRSPHTSTTDLNSRTVPHSVPCTSVHERPLPRYTRRPGNGRVAVLSDSILKNPDFSGIALLISLAGGNAEDSDSKAKEQSNSS